MSKRKYVVRFGSEYSHTKFWFGDIEYATDFIKDHMENTKSNMAYLIIKDVDEEGNEIEGD